MAGKTISAHVDEDTARRIAELAAAEQRSPSQIAAAAIRFYTQLPTLAHDALRRFQAHATFEESNLMLREVTRAINNAGFDAATRVLAEGIAPLYEGRLESEEEIEAEAVRLASLASARPLRATIRAPVR